jgi:soluble lytic murein transglycosylase-like protein
MDEDLTINWYPTIETCRILVISITLFLLVFPLLYMGQKNLWSMVGELLIHEPVPEERLVIVQEKNLPNIRGKIAERLFHPIVLRAANRHQVDPALVKAIIMAESSYNPRAIFKRGARGLMQLMPQTARALGVVDIFDPEHNINGGVKYFRLLMNRFDGDTRLALAAYNAGSSKVRQYQGVPPFEATKHYIKKVFKYYKHYKKEMEA